MLYVVLDPHCRLGHHVFADSDNNGPCGQALIDELIPHIEAKYRAIGTPRSRFVTGWSIAVIRLALGDKDGALAALETGLEQHASEVLPLKYDPLFDELHGNPRFEALVQKIVGAKK